jgi:hypothetical protein
VKVIRCEFGEEDQSGRLLALVWKWVLSKKVHEELGMAITSEVGDVWLIATEKDKPVGFAQIRALKNKKAHIRYLFGETLAARRRLVKESETVAHKLGCVSVFTNDREEVKVWASLGYNEAKGSRRGRFVRWEKETGGE